MSVVGTLQNFFKEIFQFVMDGDHNYFVHINQEWTNSWFDSFMPYITDFKKAGIWIILAVAIMIHKKRLKIIPILIGCIIAVGLSDIFAARVVKPFVQRGRPEVAEKNVRLLVPSQKSYSFPSNHASNTFAAAFFLLAAYPGMGLVALAVAIVVSYSRVYVGVHFPLDVVFGGLIGFFFAALVYRFYVLYLTLIDPIKEAPVAPKSWEKRKV
jgi:undecaprenyl-diphosphatase